MDLALNYENDRIYGISGRNVVAEITFPPLSENVCNISHTFVDDSLRGQGVADRLMHAACDEIRARHKLAYPTCSYAVGWFKKHPEYMDIYIDIME